jgi:hypothetical protein
MESLMRQTPAAPCYQGTTSLESIGQYYNTYGQISATPVSNRFFAPENVLYLQQQLELLLTQLVSFPVKVPIDEEFAQAMMTIAASNPGLAYLGDAGLQQLNEMFVEDEGRIQYISLRQQRRYDQYIIREDRIRTMPYPEPSKVMKGEVVIDTSGYMMSNPFKNNYGNFLQDVLKIGGPNHGGPPRRSPDCP